MVAYGGRDAPLAWPPGNQRPQPSLARRDGVIAVPAAEARQVRLALLRDAVEAGVYYVDSTTIAERVLATIRGPFW